MGTETGADPAPRRTRKRWWVALALVALVSVGLELALRWALFRPEVRAGFLRELRRPQHYADPTSEDLYWKLRYCWTPPKRRWPDPPVFDAAVGWLPVMVEPGSYAHADEEQLGERRPLLFYGDSFANCVTPPAECFQGLWEESELGGDYGLLNYGVGGFGLDQSFLLLQESIDRFAQSSATVVFSLFVEGDIDRCVLEFRDWPKPRLRETAAGWVAQEAIEGSEAYLAQRGLGAGSFVLRYLAYGLLPESWLDYVPGRATRADKERVARYVFEALQAELDARGVPFFVLLFHSLPVMRPGREPSWQELFVRTTLDELGVAFVSMRTELERAVDETGRGVESYYVPKGEPGVGHHNVDGNRIGLRAIERGLRGDFDGAARTGQGRGDE